jgi:hypothetical protein
MDRNPAKIPTGMFLDTEPSSAFFLQSWRNDASPNGWRFEVRTGNLNKDALAKAKLGKCLRDVRSYPVSLKLTIV